MNKTLPLVVIISIAGVLRFCSISDQSVSIVETTNLIIANTSTKLLFKPPTTPSHNPTLYHVILHYWLLFFGTSATAIRSFSVLFDLGNIILIWKITNRLFALRSAHLAAALCAVSPLLIYQAQNAEEHSFLLFLVLISSFILVNSRPRNLNVLQFIYLLLLSILGTWTNLYFAFFFLAITSAVLIEDAFSSKRSLQCVLLLCCSLASIAASNKLAFQLSKGQGQILDSESILLFPYAAIRFFVGYGIMPQTYQTSAIALEGFIDNLTLLLAPTILFAVIAVFAMIRMLTQERKSAFYILLPLILPGVIAAIVSLWYPLLNEKDMTLVYPFFILLIIYGLLQLRSTEMGIALCLCVFAFGYSQQLMNPLFGNTDWLGAAAFIQKYDSSAPVVVPKISKECVKENFVNLSTKIVALSDDLNINDLELLSHPALWTIEFGPKTTGAERLTSVDSKYDKFVDKFGYKPKHEIYLPRGEGLRVTLLAKEIESGMSP